MSGYANCIFAMSEDEIEDVSSNSTNSITSEEDDELETFETEDDVDPLMYCSPRYFAFNRGTYDLMVKDLSGIVKVTIENLKEVGKGAPLNLNAWRRMKSRLILGSESALYLKAEPKLQVSYVEKWREIVLESHGGASHLPLAQTLRELKKHWASDLRDHGIASAYVKAIIDQCRCQLIEKATPNDSLRRSINKYDKTKPTEVIEVEACKLDDTLAEVQIKYHTCLRKGVQKGKHVTRYDCHRQGVPRRVQGCTCRRKGSKRCGCNFHVDVRVNEGVKHETVSVSIHGFHSGHVPGSRPDVYHLPPHPNVVSCCKDDLFDVGCARYVAKMSRRKELVHKCKASPLEQVCFRFFMIPKEVHNMANKLKIESALSQNDWTSMMQDAYALRDLGKVAHVQPYLPGDKGSPAKQPFILILQDNWMLEMCERLSENNSWAIDSTFKTNQFGLPLYAAVAPNAMGIGIPLWYMICSSDRASNHEQVALETCLKVIFSRMPKVRPNAIVIDKSWTSYNAISNVVAQDQQCWTVANGQRSQIHCRLLLCQFHAKKSWVDNLLPKVSVTERRPLYQRMCRLMHCITESAFNALCEELKVEYVDKPGVWQYIEGGWCGTTCVWRNMWPKFGRLFNYGHVDTTNLVERHWQFIKYTALRGRINRSITELVHVLIGDRVTGSCIGGTVIEWYVQRQEICDSGRFKPRANCRDQRSRLKEAERILERYVTDNNTMHIVDEARYWFRILSMTTPTLWYNVSLQCSYCDCQDLASKCKHLLGIRMIIEKHMPSLCGSLPFIDHAAQMRLDDATTDVDIEVEMNEVEMDEEVVEREQMNLEAHKTIDALQLLESQPGTMNRAEVERARQLMADLRNHLLSCNPKTKSNMPPASLQIGTKRGGSLNISQDLIGSSPNKTNAHTGRLQRGARRAKRRLPICDDERVRCTNCDGLTLRESNVCCKNCGCSLPSLP